MAVQIASYNGCPLCPLSMMREMPMKPLFVFAALLVFLAGVPVAQAFQAVQSNQVPVANAPRVADPEDIMDNQDTLNGGVASLVGNTLRFGTPTTNTDRGSVDAPSPLFLENPASRTVPSQQH